VIQKSFYADLLLKKHLILLISMLKTDVPNIIVETVIHFISVLFDE